MLTRYHYHVPTLKNQTSHMLLQIIQQTADFKTQNIDKAISYFTTKTLSCFESPHPEYMGIRGRAFFILCRGDKKNDSVFIALCRISRGTWLFIFGNTLCRICVVADVSAGGKNVCRCIHSGKLISFTIITYSTSSRAFPLWFNSFAWLLVQLFSNW